MEIPSNITGLVHEYYDRLLADDSLSDVDVFLLAIHLTERRKGTPGAGYGVCKESFVLLGRREDNFRKVVYKAKRGSLVDERNEVFYLLVKGLKRIMTITGQIEKAPVNIIKSGENFTAIKRLEEFISSEIKSDEVLLCDPHISSSSLYPFSSLKGRIRSLKILTSQICDSEKFGDYRKKMEKEMEMPVEVRINMKVHDRYLINGEKRWFIGSSIKDLGNKDSILKEISEVTASMKELFEERWAEST